MASGGLRLPQGPKAYGIPVQGAQLAGRLGVVAARLYDSEAQGWGREWRLLQAFGQPDEAHAAAQRLSKSDNRRAVPSEGKPVTRFEYQVGEWAWLVEVDDPG